MELDCGFTQGDQWFRYRAAAIIVENECVLCAGNAKADYFYSVGGGVHVGNVPRMPSGVKCWRRRASPMRWTAWR